MFLPKYFKTLIIFPKHSTIDPWRGSEYANLSINTIKWPRAMYCTRHIQKYGIFRILSVILNSDIFRPIHVLFGHIQPYCGIFGTLRDSCIFTILAYLNPGYIQNSVKAYSGIFRTLCKARILRNPAIFRILACLEPRHIHNAVYLDIFMRMQ